jgi:hypothetical protein
MGPYAKRLIRERDDLREEIEKLREYKDLLDARFDDHPLAETQQLIEDIAYILQRKAVRLDVLDACYAELRKALTDDNYPMPDLSGLW